MQDHTMTKQKSRHRTEMALSGFTARDICACCLLEPSSVACQAHRLLVQPCVLCYIDGFNVRLRRKPQAANRHHPPDFGRGSLQRVADHVSGMSDCHHLRSHRGSPSSIYIAGDVIVEGLAKAMACRSITFPLFTAVVQRTRLSAY